MEFRIEVRKWKLDGNWYWMCSHMKAKDPLDRLFYGRTCDSWREAMNEAEAHKYKLHGFRAI